VDSQTTLLDDFGKNICFVSPYNFQKYSSGNIEKKWKREREKALMGQVINREPPFIM
jgi:hypothetical protein